MGCEIRRTKLTRMRLKQTVRRKILHMCIGTWMNFGRVTNLKLMIWNKNYVRADFCSTWNRQNNLFCQLLNWHRVTNVRLAEMHTAEPLEPGLKTCPQILNCNGPWGQWTHCYELFLVSLAASTARSPVVVTQWLAVCSLPTTWQWHSIVSSLLLHKCF